MSTTMRDQLQQIYGRTFLFRSCLGKTRYETKEAALGNGVGADGFRLYAYCCQSCRGWHSTKKLQVNGMAK